MVEIEYRESRYPEIVVCEPAGHWAARMLVVLQDCQITIRQARTMEELSGYLESGGCALVAIEFRNQWLEAVIGLLGRIRRRHKGTEAILFCSSNSTREVLWLRQAGATATVSSESEFDSVMRMVRRQVKRFSPVQSVEEGPNVYVEMPWPQPTSRRTDGGTDG